MHIYQRAESWPRSSQRRRNARADRGRAGQQTTCRCRRQAAALLDLTSTRELTDGRTTGLDTRMVDQALSHPTPREVKIRVHDGVEIAVALYVPDGDGPLPTVLGAAPYRYD